MLVYSALQLIVLYHVNMISYRFCRHCNSDDWMYPFQLLWQGYWFYQYLDLNAVFFFNVFCIVNSLSTCTDIFFVWFLTALVSRWWFRRSCSCRALDWWERTVYRAFFGWISTTNAVCTCVWNFIQNWYLLDVSTCWKWQESDEFAKRQNNDELMNMHYLWENRSHVLHE